MQPDVFKIIENISIQKLYQFELCVSTLEQSIFEVDSPIDERYIFRKPFTGLNTFFGDGKLYSSAGSTCFAKEEGE